MSSLNASKMNDLHICKNASLSVYILTSVQLLGGRTLNKHSIGGGAFKI